MRNIICLLLTGTVLLTSCSKEIKLTPGIDEFDIKTEKATYKVGEEVKFNIEGNPDIITFYSGEVFSQYEYRKGRIISAEKPSLSFTSARTSGTRQPDQLRVYVLTDYSGATDFASLQSAEKYNITDKLTLAVNITFTPSGTIDLEEAIKSAGGEIKPGKPFYIAFQYIARPQAQFGNWQTWNIQAFSLVAQSITGAIPLSNMANSGFKFIEEKPESAPSTSSLTYNASNALTRVVLNAPATTVDPALLPVEVWAVSKEFKLDETDNGPDRPLSIKGNVDPRLTEYNYYYEKPGVYKVYFVATNASVSESRQVVREIEITIVEP